MFYLILFLLSSALFAIAQPFYKRKKKKFYIYSYVAIFLLALVAGLRSKKIGTDVIFYEVQVFKDASTSIHPIKDAFMSLEWIEPFFFLLNYVASWFGDINFALFLIMFIQTVFVFYGMKYFMNRAPLWAMMLAYDFAFYNLTLNLMRQGIVMALVLFSYRYVEKRQLKMLSIMAVISFFWHKSSAAAFVLLFLLYFYRGLGEKYQRLLLIMVIPISILLVTQFLGIFQELSTYISILTYYDNYTGNSGSFETGLSTIDVGTRIMLVVLVLFFRKKKVLDQMNFNTLLILLIIDLASRFLGLYTYFATRIAYYMAILEIPYVLIMLNSRRYKKSLRRACNCILLFGYAFASYWENIHFGNNATYPYISDILHVTLY